MWKVTRVKLSRIISRFLGWAAGRKGWKKSRIRRAGKIRKFRVFNVNWLINFSAVLSLGCGMHSLYWQRVDSAAARGGLVPWPWVESRPPALGAWSLSHQPTRDQAEVSQKFSLWLLLLSCFSRVRLCVTPWTAAHQAPPSTGFSRQEYWSGLP